MASVTRNMDDENTMADESMPDDREPQAPAEGESRDLRPRQAGTQPPARAESAGGFFGIYKRGQGYWTRMGTAAGAGLLALLTVAFVWENLPAWGVPKGVTGGIAGGFLVGYAVLAYWLMNKPANVDFLIATDSEMKKVNWTSRSDLIGSTKVVILFMFSIAFFLFVVDVFFGYFFKFVGVLKFGPFE